MPKRKPDRGHLDADNELKRIEKELKKEYDKAYKQLSKRADKYFEKFNSKCKVWEEKISKGEATKEEFLKWKQQEMLHNKRYDSLVKTLSQEMTKTNQMARDIVNGHLSDIYASNYNYAAFELCKESGFNLQFDLVDRRTVEKLAKQDKIPLPKSKVKIPKDLKWNEQKIKSALFQGIIQGDSNDKIASRLRKVSDMSKDASIRNARTMTTAAENSGRQDRYEEAEEVYGIEMQKTWIATLDDRTRDAHAELDGVSVDVDEPFVNSIGKIMFPGDPDADGENVYNCRCTMVTSIKGFPKDLSRRQMGKGIEGMSYDEWKKESTERAREKHGK